MNLDELLGKPSYPILATFARQWWEARQWPKSDSAHVFLAAALLEVGEAVVGEEWTGNEPADAAEYTANIGRMVAACRPVPPRKIPPPVPLTLSDTRNWNRDAANNRALEEERNRADAHVYDWREHLRTTKAKADLATAQASFARLTKAMDWIQEQGCEQGRLVTRGRLVMGGSFFDLPPSVWLVEPLWDKRFSSCIVQHRALDTYLYVTRESLDRCLHDRAGDAVAFTSKAEKDATRWLREQFDTPETGATSKREFGTKARLLYPSLSGEAFERAWVEATRNYPDRRKAGRKSKPVNRGG